MEISQRAPLDSFFASPNRSSAEEISCEAIALTKGSTYMPLLDAMPDFVMILNRNRQIIFANRKLREFGSSHGVESVYGMRAGGGLNCEHASSAPSGCGTGLACATCGALQSILAGLSGKSVTHECRLSTDGVEASDLRIQANPFFWDTINYALVIAVDISNEKRRQVLERIFFHDILNTAGGIYGITELIEDGAIMPGELKNALCSTAEVLIHEIKSQQILLAAENNELGTSPASLQSLAVIETTTNQLRNHMVAAGKTIVIAPESIDFEFVSDDALLVRVLGNLLKNALEASRPGDTVTLGAGITEAGSVFWCHNPSVMPSKVQLQIFQRSFSTKGAGRGVGTYSARLLTERYLGGAVTFDSREPEGTTFRVTLPSRGH